MKGMQHGLWLRRQEIPFDAVEHTEAGQHARAGHKVSVYGTSRQRPRACDEDCRLGQTVFAARGRDRAQAGVTKQEKIWVIAVVMTAVILVIVFGVMF